MRILFLLLLCISCGAIACKTAKKPTKTRTSSVKTKPATTDKPASPTVVDIPTDPEAATIAWLDSERLMPVLEMAQREKKPVFLEFYASWCAPCKVMEEEVFTQPTTFRYLNMNFLNFRTDIDSEAGKSIASVYEVSKLPTVIFVSPQGVVLEKYIGLANPSVLQSLGDSALAKMKN